jgi:hypothetical protein
MHHKVVPFTLKRYCFSSSYIGLVLRDETFGGVIHYGVFCGPNTYIPPRTRYGPFPGKQVNTSEIKTNDDNSFMWEVCHNSFNNYIVHIILLPL